MDSVSLLLMEALHQLQHVRRDVSVLLQGLGKTALFAGVRLFALFRHSLRPSG